MGRMKEIFMAQMEEKYQGDHDAMIQDMARVTCEELVPDMDHVCPNCFGKIKYIVWYVMKQKLAA